MQYEISSGNGPTECELAVTKLTHYLEKEYDATIIKTTPGYHQGTFKTVVLLCNTDLSAFVGSVLWICKSPYRPYHKRKNWFINFTNADKSDVTIFDQTKVEFTTCHSRGNGGQNVNKVETGVRAYYPPTNDSVVSSDERSQYANKKKAVERLRLLVENRNAKTAICQANELRITHVNLERGNASVIFEGESFKLRN